MSENRKVFEAREPVDACEGCYFDAEYGRCSNAIRCELFPCDRHNREDGKDVIWVLVEEKSDEHN